jgi:hypothetical protein
LGLSFFATVTGAPPLSGNPLSALPPEARNRPASRVGREHRPSWIHIGAANRLRVEVGHQSQIEALVRGGTRYAIQSGEIATVDRRVRVGLPFAES